MSISSWPRHAGGSATHERGGRQPCRFRKFLLVVGGDQRLIEIDYAVVADLVKSQRHNDCRASRRLGERQVPAAESIAVQLGEEMSTAWSLAHAVTHHARTLLTSATTEDWDLDPPRRERLSAAYRLNVQRVDGG